MEGDEGTASKAEEKLTPSQESDYSSMTLGFVFGIGIAVIVTVALIVTRI